MRLYDQTSPINWFYYGTKSVEEMKADSTMRILFETPCVLIDDGGYVTKTVNEDNPKLSSTTVRVPRVYDFKVLNVMCAEYDVPYDSEDPQGTYDALIKEIMRPYVTITNKETMNAIAELGEMVSELAAAINPEAATPYALQRSSAMADLYYKMKPLKDDWTIDDVPVLWREPVRRMVEGEAQDA